MCNYYRCNITKKKGNDYVINSFALPSYCFCLLMCVYFLMIKMLYLKQEEEVPRKVRQS